jgi:hypothetical protein
MRLTSFFLSLIALVFVTVSAAPATDTLLDRGLPSLLGIDWTERGHYNAPVEPWKNGARPGWYFGKHPEKYPKLFCLGGVGTDFLSPSPSWTFPRGIEACPLVLPSLSSA